MLTFILTACQQTIPSRSTFALGTVCTVTLYDSGNQKIYDEIFNRLRDIERLMSVNIAGSEINLINSSAGIEPVKVSDEVYEVIERAVYFAEISGGAFDPTVGPLVMLWGIGGENPRVPANNEIEEILPLINWRDIEIDKSGHTVYLKKPGMALDLGAIAKGYAADEAGKIIRMHKIPGAIIDLGGNILTAGVKKDKSPWRIGIQNPLDSRGAYIGIVQVAEKTVVTSGVYERFFLAKQDPESGEYLTVNNDEEGLVHFHHLFSPSTGYPANNGLLSVTVITGCSMDADALSTAVFVSGYEKGRAFAESFTDASVIFVFDDYTVRIIGDVDFILTNDVYRILYD